MVHIGIPRRADSGVAQRFLIERQLTDTQICVKIRNIVILFLFVAVEHRRFVSILRQETQSDIAVGSSVYRHSGSRKECIGHRKTKFAESDIDAVGRGAHPRSPEHKHLFGTDHRQAADIEAIGIEIDIVCIVGCRICVPRVLRLVPFATFQPPLASAQSQLRRVYHQRHPLAVGNQAQIDIATANGLAFILPKGTADGRTFRSLGFDIGIFGNQQIANLNLVGGDAKPVSVGNRLAVNSYIIEAHRPQRH